MQPPSSTTVNLKKKISLDDFEVKRIIGKGSYGDVFLVYKQSQPFAMKQIIKKKLQRQKKQYQAMVERQLLRCMKHPGIIKLKYAFQDKNKLYFVMQYCHLGEFVRFMKQHIDHFTQQGRQFYIAEIVNLLEYLHMNGITHRDIKPQNLLLSKEGHLKLVDFGTSQISQCKILSQQFKEGIEKQKDRQIYQQDQILQQPQQQDEELMSPRKRRSTFVGTSYYISPQLLQENVCQPPSDLWALGCIIYQLYYLETPFKDSTQYGVFEKIKKVQLQFPKNDIINEHAIDLIKRLLIKNPQQRLGSCSREQLDYKHLKQHPYFSGIDVDKVYTMVPPDIMTKKGTQQTQQGMQQRKKQLVNLAVKVLDDSESKLIKNKNGLVPKQESLQQKQQQQTLQQQQQAKIIRQICYQGIIQKRQFPYYEQCYMRIYSDRKLKLIRQNRPQKIEQYELQQKKQPQQTAKLLNKDSGLFVLQLKDKKKQLFKSINQSQQWVDKVNNIV